MWGRLRRGLDTSIVDNSSAFGFSIMITATFGVLSELEGSPSVIEVVGFALAAAASFTGLQAIASRGFRRRLGASPREVVMVGTALSLLSVGGGIGVAVAVASILPAAVAWPLGGFLAVGTYILLEAAELAAAADLQRRRGDPAGDTEQG